MKHNKASVEILVAAMNQQDLSLVEHMNIKTDVVIGNQTDYNEITIRQVDNLRVSMISTTTRGVGKNRNLALEFADGDIILFADDDCHYPDNLEDIVNNAFAKFPDADVILFGIEFTKGGIVYKQRKPQTGKCPLLKSLKYGTCSVAIKKTAIDRYNLHFSELFGGGCIYSHGEDTDFIINCYKNRLKVYSYGEIICSTAKDTSTCFEGYTSKYYYDVGALAKHSFGFLAIPYMIYIAYRTKESELKFCDKLKRLFNGYKTLNLMIPYK